jgi:hypothetical protein
MEPIELVKPNYHTSKDFKDWWFSLHPDVRKTMSIRSAVAAWNAAISFSQNYDIARTKEEMYGSY